LDDHDLRLAQIESALNLKPPEPGKGFLKEKWDWIINHKGTSIVLSIVLCAVGLFGKYWLDHKNDRWNHDVDERVRSVLNEKDGVNETLHSVEQTVNRSDEKLQTLEPFIRDVVTHQFETAAKLPTGALIQRIPALKNLVAVARNQSVTLDPNIVAEAGTKLVDASRQKADVWSVVLQLIGYKSFNNNFSLLPDTTDVPEFRDKYLINIPTGAVHPTFSLKGSVPANLAAQTGYIGEDRNKGMKSGPAWIVADGGEAGLDGIQLRNVIFRGVRVSYFGAPLIMKNVYFINCTFNMNLVPNTRQLVLALLAPEPSTSFQSAPLPTHT